MILTAFELHPLAENCMQLMALPFPHTHLLGALAQKFHHLLEQPKHSWCISVSV